MKKIVVYENSLGDMSWYDWDESMGFTPVEVSNYMYDYMLTTRQRIRDQNSFLRGLILEQNEKL